MKYSIPTQVYYMKRILFLITVKDKARSALGYFAGGFLLMLSVSLLSAGCKSKYPADILKPEEIKPVLLDVMVATEVKQMDTTQVTRLHIRDSITLEIHRVLAAHKIDDSLYFRSMAYYEAHPDKLKRLLDSTRAYGNILQDSLEKKGFTTTDSAGQPANPPKSLKRLPEGPVNRPKKPVNPIVKDSAGAPVVKVKKQLKKLN